MQATMALQQAAGFDGAVTGMNLLELLQVKGMARFTGRIAVQQGGKTGLLFFRDGEVIHAELGGLEGRAAFDAIVVWGAGSFSVEPKITTTRQTLDSRLQFLLIDAVRLQDEAAAGMQQGEVASTELSQQGRGVTVKERLGGVAGLQDVVLTTRLGEVLQSFQADTEGLVALGMYLVTTSARVGEGFGLGPFKGGVIQGGKSHLIALEGSNSYLFAEVAGEARPLAVEADIRRVLAGKS